MPALKEYRAKLPEDAPGWGFMYFQSAPGKMLIGIRTSMAAAWPWWTQKQAGRMGLLCAECGWDLRRSDHESRMPYNIPTRPRGWRLVCGECCNNGIDVIDQTDTATGTASVATGAEASVPAAGSPLCGPCQDDQLEAEQAARELQAAWDSEQVPVEVEERPAEVDEDALETARLRAELAAQFGTPDQVAAYCGGAPF